MSQAKLARAMDLNPNALSDFLTGKRTPPEGFYAAAAEVIGCAPDDLRPAAQAA